MSRSRCRTELMRRLAELPFLDRLELVAISGWSRGAVYPTLNRLQREGLVGSFTHASTLAPRTMRFYLTQKGLAWLARDEGVSLADLMRRYRVSQQERRLLLQRLDGVSSIYRVASALTEAAHPIRFRWYRAHPLDAAITLPDGRSVGIIRRGITAERTAFAKRIRRLWEGDLTSVLLLLAPDETRLRQVRRLLQGAPRFCALTLEADAAQAGATDSIWRAASGSARLSLREALGYAGAGREWPRERPLTKRWLAADITATGRPLASLLSAAEKRTLDLIGDWPWITPVHLGSLLGVERARLSQLLGRLTELELVSVHRFAGRSRLALTDRGIACLVRRDRTAVGAARQRWSVEPLNSEAPVGWRNVSGARNRQLLRHITHTQSVHEFVASLAEQTRANSWRLEQLDPPHRASRYFRHNDGSIRSIQPDAFAVVSRDNQQQALFLEWERRAVRPTTMAARLAPYLRYYRTPRPTDDHGTQPTLLVVFEDELAADQFLRVAEQVMSQASVSIPLKVSDAASVERHGPLGPAWRSPNRVIPDFPLAALGDPL
ncbi:MAG: replication-relaxation family protein [Chloroflexi bacterium]|nr:replication-relaxation family protein [Chloroflexota bacterium]